MSLLFETIRIVNGNIKHIVWHEKRMNNALGELWGNEEPVALHDKIKIPLEFMKGETKCNIHYEKEITGVEFSAYQKKIIHSLKLATCDYIDYHLKFANRSLLKTLLAQSGEADEIIIVKDGLITDTSMSNLIFYDGDYWYTPARPLLPGTCRERLIYERRITERDICPEDLDQFSGVKLINAMRDPDEEEMIPIEKIIRS